MTLPTNLPSTLPPGVTKTTSVFLLNGTLLFKPPILGEVHSAPRHGSAPVNSTPISPTSQNAAGPRPVIGAFAAGDCGPRLRRFTADRAALPANAQGYPPHRPGPRRAVSDAARRASTVRLGGGRPLPAARRHEHPRLRVRHGAWLLAVPLRRVHPLNFTPAIDRDIHALFLQ